MAKVVKKVVTSLRIPADLKEAIAAAAKAEDRSATNYMLRVLREAVEKSRDAKK